MTEPTTRPVSTDERPYDEALWRKVQDVYFRLLDIQSGRARSDPAALAAARQVCAEAESVLRSKVEDYDDFVQRVWLSERFYSDSARMKKTETYLKQLFLKKNRIEQILRELGG